MRVALAGTVLAVLACAGLAYAAAPAGFSHICWALAGRR
jgi:hypothetical protein